MRRNSKNEPYMKALREIKSSSAPLITRASPSELREEIELVSAKLRGPLNNAERLDAIEQRHWLKGQLALLEGQPK